jgi:uncharacterized lipoprotein YehR (DUF1307 family)
MRKAIIGLVAIVAMMTVAGCGDSEGSGSQKKASDAISDGTYLVGTDIPAGRYKGSTVSSDGYWQISRDANGQDIIANENTKGDFYLEVKQGQYLNLYGVEIARIK